MSRIESLIRDVLSLEPPMLLALDVDGTIAPIVRNPDQAQIPPETLATLESLATLPSLRLALLTGRDLSSLGRMEQLQGIWRAVEHGGLVLAPGEQPGDRPLPPERAKALKRFAEWVQKNATDAFIEYKPQSVAVHVRAIAENDPERAERLLEEVDELATSLGLHVRRGRALREAEALRHDKGQALREIFERTGARTVFFIGDDLTDFPAVEFASERGIGAFVRSSEQQGASLGSAVLLEGVEEVTEILSQLAKRLAP